MVRVNKYASHNQLTGGLELLPVNWQCLVNHLSTNLSLISSILGVINPIQTPTWQKSVTLLICRHFVIFHIVLIFLMIKNHWIFLKLNIIQCWIHLLSEYLPKFWFHILDLHSQELFTLQIMAAPELITATSFYQFKNRRFHSSTDLCTLVYHTGAFSIQPASQSNFRWADKSSSKLNLI